MDQKSALPERTAEQQNNNQTPQYAAAILNAINNPSPSEPLVRTQEDQRAVARDVLAMMVACNFATACADGSTPDQNIYREGRRSLDTVFGLTPKEDIRTIYKGPWGLIVNKLQRYGVKVDIAEDATPAQVSQAIRYGIQMLHDKDNAKLTAAQRKNGRLQADADKASALEDQVQWHNMFVYRLMQEHKIPFDPDMPLAPQWEALQAAIALDDDAHGASYKNSEERRVAYHNALAHVKDFLSVRPYGVKVAKAIDAAKTVEEAINAALPECAAHETGMRQRHEGQDKLLEDLTTLAKQLGYGPVSTLDKAYLFAAMLAKKGMTAPAPADADKLIDDIMHEDAEEFTPGETMPRANPPSEKYKGKDLEALADANLKQQALELLGPYYDNERRRKLLGMPDNIDDLSFAELFPYLKSIVVKHQEGFAMYKDATVERAKACGLSPGAIDSYSGVVALSKQCDEQEAHARRKFFEKMGDMASEYGVSRLSVDTYPEAAAFLDKFGDKIRELAKTSLLIGKETDEARMKVDAECRTPYGAAIALANENVQMKALAGIKSQNVPAHDMLDPISKPLTDRLCEIFAPVWRHSAEEARTSAQRVLAAAKGKNVKPAYVLNVAAKLADKFGVGATHIADDLVDGFEKVEKGGMFVRKFRQQSTLEQAVGL